jgi:hypothetical protein
VPFREQEDVEPTLTAYTLPTAQPLTRQEGYVQTLTLFRRTEDVVQHGSLHCNAEVLQDLLEHLPRRVLVLQQELVYEGECVHHPLLIIGWYLVLLDEITCDVMPVPREADHDSILDVGCPLLWVHVDVVLEGETRGIIIAAHLLYHLREPCSTIGLLVLLVVVEVLWVQGE